ncbi:MAG: M81 family metallopeptidase [Burkholderiales bacterium]
MTNPTSIPSTCERPVPRIAVGGFMLESNSHSPVATAEEFAGFCDLAGDALAQDWLRPDPLLPRTTTGFVAAMDARGAWTPVPLRHAHAGASGCVDQDYFDALCDDLCERLQQALPVDGVFLSLHGAAIATVDPDPEATLLERVRALVGSSIPVVATLDLHGNISQRMVSAADVLISYRENPHTDMYERGEDCAAVLHEMLAGLRPTAAFVKLPFVPPSVTQNTAFGPYRALIEWGQSRIDPDVIDVSILSGFTLGDTPRNGMSVIVTTRNAPEKAKRLACEIAAHAWAHRGDWIPKLTSLEQATQWALASGQGVATPRLFADVADNPGGGGRGNTVWILKAFAQAGVEGAVFGPIYDPLLAAQAHQVGAGAVFQALFNRDETHPLSGRFEAAVQVERVHAGDYLARRGISKGSRVDNGPTALLRLGGIQVLVISRRDQARDPAQFEVMGIDLSAIRVLVLKSRGHFRAAFDEFFANEQIVEVDVPGLTTPVLSQVDWQRMPRPIYPLDPDMHWEPPGLS